MHQIGYQSYLKTDVITADPKRLVALCYEEAIRSLNMAKESYQAGEFETKGKAVEKALTIINELRGALDFNKGGDIAKQLDRIYAFMTLHIMRADQKKDIRGFSEVMMMLGELSSAWKNAFKNEQGRWVSSIPSRGPDVDSQPVDFIRSSMDSLR